MEQKVMILNRSMMLFLKKKNFFSQLVPGPKSVPQAGQPKAKNRNVHGQRYGPETN
jgi:hypothetical protein